jgi:hypothetical protein
MNKTAVRYGVFALVFTIIWTMMEHIVGFNTTNHEAGQYARMVGAIVFWAMIFVAIYQRRKQQGGLISFGQGFGTGAGVSIIYSLGCCVWYALYGEVINTQFKPTLMAFERAKLEAAHISADLIEAKMKQVDMTTGGSVLSYVFLIVFMFLLGAVVSVIAALIFQRKKKATV